MGDGNEIWRNGAEWHPNWKKSCQPFLSWVEVPSSGGTYIICLLNTYLPYNLLKMKEQKAVLFNSNCPTKFSETKSNSFMLELSISPGAKRVAKHGTFPWFFILRSFSSAHHRCCCLLSSEEQTHWTLQAPSKNEDWAGHFIEKPGMSEGYLVTFLNVEMSNLDLDVSANTRR